MGTGEPIEIAKGLCAHERRLAGTDAERRAAAWLAAQLKGDGWPVRVESTYVHPQSALVHALHAAVAIAASVASVFLPPVGFAALLVVATATYLDLSGRLYLTRRLFFRRSSQNVVARSELPEARARVILVAHYDAPRASAFASPWIRRLANRLGRMIGAPFTHYRALFWSMALLVPMLGVRLAGLESDALSLLQLPPTLLLLLLVYTFVDARISEPSPGANDNASGVGAAITAAAGLRHRLEHTDVWLVLAGGCEPEREGLNAFVRRHREELASLASTFICIDSVGSGRLVYERSGGPTVSLAVPPSLVELCAALAEAGIDGEAESPLPFLHGMSTDATPARVRGLSSITIARLEESEGTPPRWHSAEDLPEALEPQALDGAAELASLVALGVDRAAGRAPAPAAEEPRSRKRRSRLRLPGR